MYLPQFHRVRENDEWWGEGYTEWTAVKSAESLFEGHLQPRVPLHHNYYNLLKKETMQWQAELMKKYQVEGLCFYHYYFKDGRKILEKPAENLLTWKDIDMKFCFCWANETWARSWNRFGGVNSWNDSLEMDEQKDDLGVLLEQKYGREESWKEHFEYLLPFFKDSRYIRNENGNPIFLIHRPTDIVCLNEMIEYWKKLAIEKGIKPVFVIGSNIKYNKPGLDAVLFNAPASYMDECRKVKVNGITAYDYEEVWKSAIKKRDIRSIKTYFGVFQDYDDTPRRGKNGTVFLNSSVDIFKKYVLEICKKNVDSGNEYLFINAWNEWGEGMYLEPDDEKKYSYLEALSECMDQIREYQKREFMNEEDSNIEYIDFLEKEVEKYKANYELLDKWLFIIENQKNVSEYLSKKKYKNIAIYGFSSIGKHLYTELKKEKFNIKYVFDQNTSLKYESLKIKQIEDIRDDVDVIIVTAIFYYDEIRNMLGDKVKCPIISLREIIEEII